MRCIQIFIYIYKTEVTSFTCAGDADMIGALEIW